MNQLERKSVSAIAVIMCLRMLGLFMIFPVFTPFAQHLPNATPQLIGVALGIYGLTQACLQIPFGILSDRFGRKPIICLGLIIFALGSLVAANAHSIEGIIIGRALQGGGAIGSAAMAFIADITHDSQRTKAMAIIGMSIGIAFALAMVVGPSLNTHIGVPGIFWLTMILALLAIAILYVVIPSPAGATSWSISSKSGETATSRSLLQILVNKQLLPLNFGVFIQHSMLTAMFVVIPLILQERLHLTANQQWLFYLPILVCAYLLMVPFIILAEKKQQQRTIFIGGVLTLFFSQLLLFLLPSSVFTYLICLTLFFTAFTLLEAMLPSLVSKLAPTTNRGGAMGVYSTCQFLGIFIGGLIGGWLFAVKGIQSVFIGCAVAYLLWFIIVARFQPFPNKVTQ